MDHSSYGQEDTDTEVELDNLWREVDDILSLSDNDLVQEDGNVDASLIYTKLDCFVSRCIDYYGEEEVVVERGIDFSLHHYLLT
jgi:hypothetical protein